MMLFIRKYLAGLVIIGIMFFGCACPAFSTDLEEQKQELEKIRKEMDDSQKNLDSLKNVEKKVLKDIADYEQRASMNKTVLERLNKQLKGLRKEMDVSKDKLETSGQHYSNSHSRYLSNLKYYYAGIRPEGKVPADEIKMEKDAFKKKVYLKALAEYDKEELTMASDLLQTADKEFSDLVSQEKSVSDVRKKKSSEYTIITSQKEKKERDLSKVRLKKENEADKLITLTEAARQMEDLVARLEQARLDREKSSSMTDFDFTTGHFATYKGSLFAPIKGAVTNGFGWKTDKITKLKSFSPGIEIKGAPKGSVISVAAGMVAYIGNLRGYDNFVIIEHEDGYYSTYAGLDNLTVIQNQIVDKGDRLGNAPTGIIKFELRQGREPLDPVEWILIDSFK